ncbi:MAG: hypothetical protein IPK82_40790 [Polyangiaceae bacterium]|nr:hypothetical protein [Polyangiaceae bacterium]
MPLHKVGTYKKPISDPALKAPADVAKALAAPRDDVEPASDGTWYFHADEPATILVRGRKTKVVHHRICWMEGDTARRAIDIIPSNSAPSFDKTRSVAYVTASEARIFRLFLNSGKVEQIRVEGIQFDPDDKDPALTKVDILADGRLIVHLPSYPSRLFVCEPHADGFRVQYNFTFLGEYAVVSGRFLVGGGLPVVALAFTSTEARIVANYPEADCDRVYIVGNVPRLYSKAGCFEVLGLDEAWVEFEKHPTTFPIYPGWQPPA